MTKKRQKNDNASRKMQFLPPAKSAFFLSFVCHFLSFFCHFGAIFLKIVKNPKILRKMTEK
jgi:hypothetical protein